MKINTTQYTHKELLCLILIGITGSAAVNILPFIVSALAAAPALNLAGATTIASVELLGLSVAALSYRYWRNLGTAKHQVSTGVLGYCLGNLAIMMLSLGDFGLILWRLMAGAGAGVASAVAFSAIGRQRDPDGIFTILVFFQVLWSAIGSFVMPSLMALISWKSAFGYLLLFGVINLVLVWRCLPELEHEPLHRPSGEENPGNKALVLLATVLWYVTLGLYWSDSAETGNTIGVDPMMLGAIFALGYLVSLFGNGIALWLSQRFSRQGPMMISGAMHGVVYIAFAFSKDSGHVATYVLAVLVFSLIWAVFTPFQIGLFSSVQSDGRFTVNFLPSSIVGILIGTALTPALDEAVKLWSSIVLIVCCLLMYQLYQLRSTRILEATPD